MSRAYIPRAIRTRVAAQARRRCGYCLSQESVIGVAMEVDHIIPEAAGGPTVEENLWLACEPCNARKSNRIAGIDPVTLATVRLFNPRYDVWSEHFEWSADGGLVVGLTAIGRATVETLDLNRSPLVGARRRWASAGWHPPAD